MQLVDLALAVDVLKPPHPPLASGVNLERLVGGAHEVEEHDRSPTAKIAIETKNGMIDQAELERNRAVNRLADLQPDRRSGTSPRTRSTSDHDEQREERRDRDDEEIQVVHRAAPAGGLFRKERNPRKHRSGSGVPLRGASRVSRRRISTMNPDDRDRRSTPRRGAGCSSPPRRSGRGSGRTGSSRATARRSTEPTLPFARFDKRQPQILRRELDAVEVAGQRPIGRWPRAGR